VEGRRRRTDRTMRWKREREIYVEFGSVMDIFFPGRHRLVRRKIRDLEVRGFPADDER
jgi:DNA repair photolyase